MYNTTPTTKSRDHCGRVPKRLSEPKEEGVQSKN